MLHILPYFRVVRPLIDPLTPEISPYEHVVLSALWVGKSCTSEPYFRWNLAITFLNGTQWNLSMKKLSHFADGKHRQVEMFHLV